MVKVGNGKPSAHMTGDQFQVLRGIRMLKSAMIETMSSFTPPSKSSTSIASYTDMQGERYRCNKTNTYGDRCYLPILSDLEAPIPVCTKRMMSSVQCHTTRRSKRTGIDLTVVVHDAASDMVRSRTCHHTGRRLLGVKVLDVRLAFGVRAVRTKHLLHLID